MKGRTDDDDDASLESTEASDSNSASDDDNHELHCVANLQVLADRNDNHFYFFCKKIGLQSQFMIYRKECPNHSSFDSDLLVCVVNEIDGGEDTDSNEKEEHRQNVDFECSKAGNYTDSNDETKYYECKDMADGKLERQHRNCHKYQKFRQQDQQCIPMAAVGRHSFLLLKFVMVKKIVQDE